VETHAIQFPSRAFTHIAPPWAQALHAPPGPAARSRSNHPSDDLMLTESDLEAMIHSAYANEADPHVQSGRQR
jgi:hypothetical protein